MKKLNTVLLVDDDETTNFFHKFIIEKVEVAEKVEEAMNGEEALKILNKEENTGVDLIFLDVNMPVMNGFEFLEKFEELPEGNRAKCVIMMLTTSLHPDDQKKAESFKSLAGYYNKPLTQEMIEEITEKFF